MARDNSIRTLIHQSIQRGKNLLKKMINRAIVIDFEGVASARGVSQIPRPAFLGVLKSGSYRGYFIDDRFSRRMIRSARSVVPERITTGSLTALIASLVEQAEQEDRVILHFSCHEPELLEQHLDNEDLVLRLRAVLADGKPLMERGAEQLTQRKTASACLDDLAGILVPETASQQAGIEVGNTIRALEKAASRGTWTESSLRKLSELLAYNRLDLEMLQQGTREARRIL